MTNPNFDWMQLLPEDERKAALAKRTADNEAFFKGFPIHPGSAEAKQDADELQQAARDGRAIFERAKAIVDNRVHICSSEGCSSYGQPSPRSCKCGGRSWA